MNPEDLPYTKEEFEILPYSGNEYLTSLLDEYSRLIREYLHFGSKLLKWDVEKNFKIEDNVLPSLYFRNILELIDGISILVKDSSIDPAKLLARSLIESSLNLFYLIEKDSQKRTNMFLVWKLKNEIKNHRKYVSSDKMSKQFQAKLNSSYHNIDFSKYLDLDLNTNQLNEKITVLKNEKYKETAIEYERTKKIVRNPPWYSLFNGPRDLEQLAGHFKMVYEYEFLYRNYSKNVHAAHVTKGLAPFKENNAQIIQIRDFEESKILTVSVLNLALDSFNRFIQNRLPEYSSDMKTWFVQVRNIRNIIMAKEFIYKK